MGIYNTVNSSETRYLYSGGSVSTGSYVHVHTTYIRTGQILCASSDLSYMQVVESNSVT